jgi:hypothetical protein
VVCARGNKRRWLGWLQVMKNRLIRWVENMFFIQLVLTFFALPILVWWGLPLSLLTVIGNVIFSPCILIFLFLSSLLFFGQLCGLPVGWVAWALDGITTWWLKIIKLGSTQALVAVPRPSLWFLALIPVIPLVWLYSPWGGKKRFGIAVLSLILILITVGCRWLVPRRVIIEVPWSEKQTLQVFYENGSCCIVDLRGVIRRRSSLQSWVTFTLRPELSTKLGCMNCWAIVLMYPTPARIVASCELAQQIGADIIVIPESETTRGEFMMNGIRVIPVQIALLREWDSDTVVQYLHMLCDRM